MERGAEKLIPFYLLFIRLFALICGGQAFLWKRRFQAFRVTYLFLLIPDSEISQISGSWKGGDPISCPDPGTNGSTLNQVRMFARLLCLSRLPSPDHGPHSSPAPLRTAPSELAAAGEQFPSVPPSFTQDVHIRTSASAGFHGRSL